MAPFAPCAPRLYRTHRRHRPWTIALAALAVTLAGCGGGGGGDGGSAPAAASCDLASQKEWLRADVQQRYYWSGQSPNPEPGPFASVASYFDALLYRGDTTNPGDRWSYISDTAAYEQFFAEGRTLGYGLFVNGAELSLPLRVRFVEARSPAAAAGLRRGDILRSVNGRDAATLVASGNFAALSPTREGETVSLDLEAADGTRRVVTLAAATFDLTPVPVATTLTRPDGGKVGYVVLKDFITQAETPLREGIARIRSEGANELILDLRYNGGGRVSTSTVLGSLIAGVAHQGKVFTELRYSARQSALNSQYRIDAGSTGFDRVVVLTGSRTCSASELVVNGLKAYLPVTTVGSATCGKPFGFNPTPNCGSTYSHVNFESFNGLGAGRYYDGIAATCAATDTFTGELGRSDEPMTARALATLQAGGVCAAGAGVLPDKQATMARPPRPVVREPGEPLPGMFD